MNKLMITLHSHIPSLFWQQYGADLDTATVGNLNLTFDYATGWISYSNKLHSLLNAEIRTKNVLRPEEPFNAEKTWTALHTQATKAAGHAFGAKSNGGNHAQPKPSAVSNYTYKWMNTLRRSVHYMENRAHYHIIPKVAIKAIGTIPFPSLQAKQGEEAKDWLNRLALNLPLFRKAFQESRKADLERRNLMEKEALQLLFTTNLSRFLDTVMGKAKVTTRGAAPIPDEQGVIPDNKKDRLDANLKEYIQGQKIIQHET